MSEAARDGVAGEVARLSDDLRRQISDLGRLIVNDLGRLPKLLCDRPATEPEAPAEPPDDALDLREPPEAAPGGDLGLPYAAGDERRGLFRRR